jgi:hypothetical protein
MAEASDSLQGGCACGAVRYRLGAAPMFVHCCHCRDCQRQTGSAFVLNALVETERIVLLAGEPVPVAVPTDSGRPHRIFRCPACQTAVWSEYGGAANVRFVRVGTLDQPAVVMPDVHIYVRSKLPWVSLPAGVPAFEAYYDARKLCRRRASSAGAPCSADRFASDAKDGRARPASNLRRKFYFPKQARGFHTGAPGDRQGVGGASSLR